MLEEDARAHRAGLHRAGYHGPELMRGAPGDLIRRLSLRVAIYIAGVKRLQAR